MKKIFFLLISINIYSRNIILLLGGINRPNATYMEKIKEALSQEGREIIDDINVEAFTRTISGQAEDVYNILIEKKNVTAQDRIIIIGHSQGGLRGYELYRNYKTKLNIVALFTISTPWRGAGILEKTEELYDRLNKMRTILEKNGEHHDTLRNEICKETDLTLKEFKDLISSLSPVCDFLKKIESSIGINDLKVGSLFIRSLSQEANLSNLNNNKIAKDSLPIFNIIGNKIDIDKYFSSNKLREAAFKIENMIKNVSASNRDNVVAGTALTTAALFPLMGPFAFIFTGIGVIASTVTYNETYNQGHLQADEPLKDLKYLANCIDYIKKLASNNSNDHDLILSIHEQSLPLNLDQTLNQNMEILIEEALHDGIDIDNNIKISREKLEKINSKSIYNKDDTIKFIKEKVKGILTSKEQKYVLVEGRIKSSNAELEKEER